MTKADGEAPGGGRETRKRILASAAELIEEGGLGALRIRDIARRSGIRESSVYNHFEGKLALVQELFRTVDASLSPLGAILDLEASPIEELEALKGFISSRGFGAFLSEAGEHLIAAFEADPGAFRLLRQAMGERLHEESAAAAYEGVVRRDMARVFRSASRLAAEAGALPPGLEPEALADLALACFEQALASPAPGGGLGGFAERLRSLLRTLGSLVDRGPGPDYSAMPS